MRRLLFLILALLILPSRWAGAQSAVTEDLTVVSDSVTFQVPGTATGIVISVTGTWSATIDLTYSMRGTYRALTCLDLTTLGYVTSISANADLFCVNHGYGSVKATASAYTSGTASVLIRARSGPPSAQTSIGSVNLNGITLNAGRIPVLADINNTSSVTASRNNAIVEGCVAVDADVSACQPVQIGGSGSTAVPPAASADGDMVRAWFSRNGVLHVMNTAGTATLTNVADTASSTALIAANIARLHAKCFNDSTSILYINYGATASATAFTERVEPGGRWYMELPIYTGVINGIWSADASGSARCTELAQ